MNAGNEHDAERTSGYRTSYWLETEAPFDAPPLQQSAETDVVVVGAGIAGLSTALALLESGKKVIVLEDGLPGSGESGRTTAHITPALDDRYYFILDKLGKQKATLAAQSHWKALDWIERTVKEYGIDCHFRRVDGYLFRHPSDDPAALDKELDASEQAGLVVEKVRFIPGIQHVDEALRFPDHAQFHILKYLNGLCRAIVQLGGRIHCHSRVTGFKKGEVSVNGHTVRAASIVVATNTPANDMVTMHTKQYPYRTYVVGALISRQDISPALWWDTGDPHSEWNTQPYHYVRLEEYDHEHYLLIAGGEDHKTGQADKEGIPEEDRYERLESWVQKHFPAVGSFVYRWSGQVMEPLDGVAFIGRNPGDDQVYIITGDSGNGMTHATIGALLITDMINRIPNPWEELYDPSRLMWKVPLDFASEALNMAAQYGDYFSRSDLHTIRSLPPDAGAILQSGWKKYAVYRDADSKVHAFSAICPHLGCILQWNADERSFDCPCHGSRFSCYGKLENGPAISDLTEIPEEDFKKKRIQ